MREGYGIGARGGTQPRARAADSDGTMLPLDPPALRWGLPRRIVFRFAFVYFAVYIASFPWTVIPKTQWLVDAMAWLWQGMVGWVGAHVFGVEAIYVSNGSGDRA